MKFWKSTQYHSVPPEISLILALCRLRENHALQSLHDFNPVNWQLFVELVSDHKLAGALYSTLKSFENLSVPTFVFESLKQSHDANVVRSLAQEATIEDIANLLGSQGIRVLFFKGLATAKILHPNSYAAGFSSDVDIYVAPEDLERTVAALSACGYLANPKNIDLNSPSIELLMQMHHSVSLTSETFGTEIDLHYQLLQNPHWFGASFDELFERREFLQFGNTELSTLGAVDLAAYLCCHAVDHNCHKIKWIDDAALAVQRVGNHDQFKNEISQLKYAAPKAIERAQSLIDCVFPVQPDKGWPHTVITHDRSLSRMVRAATKNEPDTPQSNIFSYGLARFHHFLQRCRIGGSGAAVWTELFLSLSSPDDVNRLGWGKRWKLLYMLVGPIFIAKRFFNRTNEQPSDASEVHKGTAAQ